MAASGDLLMATASVHLLVKPSRTAPVVAVIHKGDRVVELLRSPGRKYVLVVRQGDHDKGWVAAESLRKASKRVSMVTELADLGFRSGYLIEGPESKQAHNFYFSVPRDAVIDGGVVHVHYQASSILNQLSHLRVDVNDIPRTTALLSGQGGREQVLTVRLQPRDLKGGLLKLTLWTTLVVQEDSCLDSRVNTSYLQIQPDTSLALDVRVPVSSVRGYWDLLPATVRISLPDRPLREEEFRAAWEMSEMLIRQGKKVLFIALPKLGQVVVAPVAEIRASLDELYHDWPQGAGGKPLINPYQLAENTGQVGLVNAVGGSFIAFTEPFANAPLYLLDQQWRGLAAGFQYQGLSLDSVVRMSQDHYEFRFDDLGMDTSPRRINTEVEWNLSLSSTNALFPPNYIPERLNLEIIASPSQTDDPLIMSIYLNNVLQEVLQFEDNGELQSFSVNLSEDYVSFFNELRFSVLRSDEMGDCKGSRTRYPIQILPQSTLVMKRSLVEPQRFSELRPYFAEGFQLLLPSSALSRPKEQLSLLAQLSADMSLDVENGSIRFYEQGEELHPSAPFLLLGRADVKLDRVPVRLDRGGVQVRDSNNRILLNTTALPGVTVAQVVESGSHYGLWLAPAHDGDWAAIQSLQLNDNDVAFMDKSGVVLTFDSRRDVFLKPYYPEYLSWFDLLGRYRYWLVTLGWVIFVLGAIYLFRQNARSRQQQKE